jgi:hypothetical protein
MRGSLDWKLFLSYSMTPGVLKGLCNLQLDGVFHMGQDCIKLWNGLTANSFSFSLLGSIRLVLLRVPIKMATFIGLPLLTIFFDNAIKVRSAIVL